MDKKTADRKASSVIVPIGTCQGLNSSNSPRLVTSTTQGKPQLPSSENILMQLPTPLDCISKAARWPPSEAPATRPTPSSSVVRTNVGDARIVAAQRDQTAMAGVGYMTHLANADAPEMGVYRIGP
jgi:hypothetical protein